MSEDESFVILGSSPLPSIAFNSAMSLRADGPQLGSDSSSLKNIDLRECMKSIDRKENVESSNEHNTMCVLKHDNDRNTSFISSESGGEGQASLAAGFILGEVNADVLKNSVHSQFPSLCSVQACAEDVVKLQNLMTEYIDLKQTLAKVNNTMKLYYDSTRQWREEAAKKEQQYQKRMDECHKAIQILREENWHLKSDMQTYIEQIKISEEVRQKENAELRQAISEKSSLITNMRVQIDEMERQQMQSFEFIPQLGNNESRPHGSTAHKKRESQFKDIESQMSILVAENLQFKDMQKTYIDEINCLKINLTSAEELLNRTRADLAMLRTKEAEHTEELAFLRQQVDIYRRDFEMERADREKNASEKEQYLLDLRALQRRNHDLIETLSEANKTKKNIPTSSTGVSKEETAPVLEQNYGAAPTSNSVDNALLRCPICSERYSSLSTLQSHVNACLDNN